MGRNTMTIRVSEAERAAIEGASHRAQMPRSTWARQVLVGVAGLAEGDLVGGSDKKSLSDAVRGLATDDSDHEAATHFDLTRLDFRLHLQPRNDPRDAKQVQLVGEARMRRSRDSAASPSQ